MAENQAIDETALGELITDICGGFENRANALLEILHTLQAELSFVPEEAIKPIANILNLSRAEVHGVVSFYHDFLRTPPGKRVIKICRAECCQGNGSEALAAHAEKVLGVPFGTTTEDGEHTLKGVYCLGNCTLGPSVLIGEELFGRVDAQRFDEIIEAQKQAQK